MAAGPEAVAAILLRDWTSLAAWLRKDVGFAAAENAAAEDSRAPRSMELEPIVTAETDVARAMTTAVRRIFISNFDFDVFEGLSVRYNSTRKSGERYFDVFTSNFVGL